jgi:hypothetical protein
MDIANIMAFCGKHLEDVELDNPWNARITMFSTKKFIDGRDEVASPVKIEDVEKALGLLLIAGFLEVDNVNWDESNPRYKRFLLKANWVKP